MKKISLPNALSASRLVLAPLLAACLLTGHQSLAMLLFFVAIGTDLLDGYLARLWNQTSAFGGFLDHSSDAIFIGTTLAVLSSQGYISWLLPPLVLLSFAQYALDSKALLGYPLRGSQLGRYNGIAYFVIAGFPIAQEALEFRPAPYEWIEWFAWLLICTTMISMLNRLVAFIRLKSDSNI